MDTGSHNRNMTMQRERRRNFRVQWNSPATIHDPQRQLDRPCILSNFSNGGAEITGVRAATIPDEFMLQIARDNIRKCRVIWRTELPRLWDEIREKIFKNYAIKSMDDVNAKLDEAAFYIERNPTLVRSITSFPYIAKSL
jgi:hypothetical protein